MEKLKKKLNHIHYVNNLWHISQELDDRQTAAFFKNRKKCLQNAVIDEYLNDVSLNYDSSLSVQSGKDIYSIEFNAIKANACHIPIEDIEPESKKKLLK